MDLSRERNARVLTARLVLRCLLGPPRSEVRTGSSTPPPTPPKGAQLLAVAQGLGPARQTSGSAF